MANISIHDRPHLGLSFGGSALAHMFRTWRTRARQRAELAHLDHRMVRDLGLSAQDIQFEANKPFWRA